MLLGEARMYEVLQVIASSKEGTINSEEFRAAVFPKHDNTGAARRLLGELVKKRLAEVRNGKFAITFAGMSFLRGEGLPESAKASLPPELGGASIADQLMQIAVRRGVRIPGPPVTQAFKTRDGFAMHGPRGELWYTPGPGTPWRCRSGPPTSPEPDTLFEIENGRVRVRPRTRDWVPLADDGRMMHPPRPLEAESGSLPPW